MKRKQKLFSDFQLAEIVAPELHKPAFCDGLIASQLNDKKYEKLF